MKFFVLLLLLWGIGIFYRREHLRLPTEIASLQQKMQGRTLPADCDWRIIRYEEKKIYLRRAFQVRTKEDLLRYTAPIFFLAIIMIILQAWAMALTFVIVLAVKWFGSSLRLDPDKKHYEIMLGPWKLYGEDLPDPDSGAVPSGRD